jgi:hypothetical protein
VFFSSKEQSRAFRHCKYRGGWSKTNNYVLVLQKRVSKRVYIPAFLQSSYQSGFIIPAFYGSGYGNYFIACFYSVEHTRFFSKYTRIFTKRLLKAGMLHAEYNRFSKKQII